MKGEKTTGLMIGLDLGGKSAKGEDEGMSKGEGSGEIDMKAARVEALKEFFTKGAEGDYEAADAAWDDYKAACEES